MYIFAFLIVAAVVAVACVFAYKLLVSEKTDEVINNVVDKDLEDRVDDVIREKGNIKSEVSNEERRVRNIKNKTRKL
jgi:hypothetical protein